MKRSMENQLIRWLQKLRRKPVVIRGDRQVGKSTLVQNFARSQGLKVEYTPYSMPLRGLLGKKLNMPIFHGKTGPRI